MTRRMLIMAAGSLLAANAANAQTYSTTFEAPTYTGSASGTLLTAGFTTPPTLGQDGWYVPVTGSNDFNVIPYAGNTFGVPVNPSGGDQCVVGILSPVGGFARGQHAVNFSSGGKWKVTFDVYGRFAGVLPANDNMGSFSLQPSLASQYFQALMSYGATAVGPAPNATNHTATGSFFHMALGIHTAALPTTIAFNTPSPAFRDLPVDQWYRVSMSWDFGTRLITEASIQNLTTGSAVTTVDVSANLWYLYGGPAGVQPLPTDVRLFTGGGAGAGPVGNHTAWDNVKVEKIISCYPDCTGDGALTVGDFGCFQGKYVLGDMYADCTGEGTLTVGDFGCFQGKYVLGCP